MTIGTLALKADQLRALLTVAASSGALNECDPSISQAYLLACSELAQQCSDLAWGLDEAESAARNVS